MNSSAKYGSGLTGHQWVDIIVRSFIKDMDIDPCVFRIPESLRDAKPEAYTPQLIGLGPYHHFRPEFVEMEAQKCVTVRKFLNQEQNLAFKELVVNRIKVLEPVIRACYDKYLDFDCNTLAWIMAIDGLYLLQFVSAFVGQDRRDEAVVDADFQSLATDTMMLENQIPIVLLKEISMALQLQSPDPTKNWALHDFYLFCKQQSPFKLTEELEFQSDFGQVHLLDYMYQLIVNHQVKKELISPVATIDNPKEASSRSSAMSVLLEKTKGALASSTTEVLKVASNSAAAFQMAVDTAAAFGIKGAAEVQNHLRLLHRVRQMLPGSRESHKTDHEADAPSVDEIDIPSVSELCEISKIRFKLAPGGIRDVEFDDKDKVFYLPVITLDSNSEVLLRNLVAYEAQSAKPAGSSLELTEYVDLMCGVIDTAKDVSLLRKEGIIEGPLADERIAHFFNSIRKSSGNHEKSKIESVVKKVNEQWSKARHKKKHPKQNRSLL